MSMELAQRGLKFLDCVNRFCGYKGTFIEKVQEGTSEEYGKLPTERPTAEYIAYGVINLDKPPGPTSHEVVAWVKKMLGVRRAGHGGTLELSPAGLGGEIPR